MVNKSMDHGNATVVAQFVFLFFKHVILQNTTMEMEIKNYQCYCKNKYWQQLCMVYSLINHTMKKWRQNVQHFVVKPLART